MEKEISSGTMLGIVLIALAAIIGIGFGIFSIAKGVANEGTTNVQDNLEAVSSSSYDDYNDKIVTGTQVKSAIQNFSGKSCAILVNTTAMNKGVVTYKTRTDGPRVLYMERKVGSKTVKYHYVNYNALLADGPDGTEELDLCEVGVAIGNDASVSDAKRLMNGTEAAKFKDGFLTIDHAYAISNDDGKIQFDYAIGGQSKTGNSEYIAGNAKFDSNLIKDTSGTTIGIMFTQIAK